MAGTTAVTIEEPFVFLLEEITTLLVLMGRRVEAERAPAVCGVPSPLEPFKS